MLVKGWSRQSLLKGGSAHYLACFVHLFLPPSLIVFALQKGAYLGFVGQGLVKELFLFLNLLVKGWPRAQKGSKERCWLSDGQGRSKKCMLVK